MLLEVMVKKGLCGTHVNYRVTHYVYSEGASATGLLRLDQGLGWTGGACMAGSTALCSV